MCGTTSSSGCGLQEASASPASHCGLTRGSLSVASIRSSLKRCLDGSPQILIKNARFYDEHRDVIRDWKRANPVFATFPESRRKLEWQAQDTGSLWETVMHFRPSGIRAKAPTYLPALVAITQTSVIGSRRRRLTPHEAARLQGFSRTLSFTGQRDSASYKQVGNGVAVGAAWHVFRTHVERDASDLPRRLVRAVLNAPLNPTGDALANEAMVHEARSAAVTQTVAS